MRSGFWKRMACAACLMLVAACAYKVSASALRRAEPAPCVVRHEPVLRGTRLFTLAGYQLNVAFTSGGRLLYFDITES